MVSKWFIFRLYKLIFKLLYEWVLKVELFTKTIACVVDTSQCHVSVKRTWMTCGSNEAQQANVTNRQLRTKK